MKTNRLYLQVEIDDDLDKRLRDRALLEERTLKAIVARALRRYLEEPYTDGP